MQRSEILSTIRDILAQQRSESRVVFGVILDVAQIAEIQDLLTIDEPLNGAGHRRLRQRENDGEDRGKPDKIRRPDEQFCFH